MAGEVVKIHSRSSNIYVIKLSKHETAVLERGQRVDVNVLGSPIIIDGKVRAINTRKRRALVKILDLGIKLVPGQRTTLKPLNPSSLAGRKFVQYKGAGLSLRGSAEFHSNYDILLGGLASLTFSKYAEIDADVYTGFHDKQAGNQVGIFAVGGRLRIFVWEGLNIAAGARYKVYSEDIPPPKTSNANKNEEGQTDTTQSQTAAKITDGYEYHDEDAVFITASTGLRLDFLNSMIAESFVLAIDVGVDFEVLLLSETIEGYHPIDPDLIGLPDGTTLFGRLSLGYYF